jgi:general stress protein CsbA
MRLIAPPFSGETDERLSNTEVSMFMGIAIAPLVALIAGILILFMPRLLNYIVAIYLIIIGIVGLLARYMPGSAV